MTMLIIHQSNTLQLKEQLTEEQTTNIKKMLKEEKSITEVAKYLDTTVQGSSIKVIQAIPIDIDEILKELDELFC